MILPALGTPFQERFFKLASVRVLLSDTAAEITGTSHVDNDRAAGGSERADAECRRLQPSRGADRGERRRRRRRLPVCRRHTAR